MSEKWGIHSSYKSRRWENEQFIPAVNPVSHEKKALLFHIIGEIKLSLFLNGCQKKIIDDSEQIRPARFCTTLEVLGHRFILSNSDLRGKNPDDDFFDKMKEIFHNVA